MDFQENNKIKIGDIVKLSKKNSFKKIHGEVLELFTVDDKDYITIYLLFNREKETFIINRKMELSDIKSNYKVRKIDAENIIYDFNDDKTPKESNIFKKSVIFLILIAFIFTSFDGFFAAFFRIKYSYDIFLTQKLTFSELYTTAKMRINYTYDYDDYWEKPVTAWNKKKGDCEEFAGIISDYLNKHSIENYLTGLTLPGNKGHAVVFAVKNGNYYIIDPTDAAEMQGVKKLNGIKTLRDAVKQYSSFPVFIYAVPEKNGDKKVIKTIF